MLPPGPREPAALQTVEWVVRPTALLRRAQARYGEPFTLRTAWSDAPLVLVSDPAEIRRIYTAPADVLQAGDSSAFLEPFVGRHSVLILNGDEHLRQRRLVLPPFHGEALRRWTDDDRRDRARRARHVGAGAAAPGAGAHAGADARGDPARDLRQPRPRAARRAARGARPDGLDAAAGGDVAARPGAAVHARGRACGRARVRADRRRAGREGAGEAARGDGGRGRDVPDSILALLAASGATREELRDQLVTLLAAGHETTATALAWALERLARHPETDLSDDAHIDAAVKEVLRTRPVLSITARKTLQPYELRQLHAARPASTSPPACTSRTAAPAPTSTPRASSTARRPTPTRSSRSAAAHAAAWAPRSPRWRCARCSERSHNASHCAPDRKRGRTNAAPQRHPRALARRLDHPAHALA